MVFRRTLIMWVVILNSEVEEVHVLSLSDWDQTISLEEYLSEELSYSLSNCEWMVVHEKPKLKYIKK
jgi:hypothetical protein